jgi:putative transposase
MLTNALVDFLKDKLLIAVIFAMSSLLAFYVSWSVDDEGSLVAGIVFAGNSIQQAYRHYLIKLRAEHIEMSSASWSCVAFCRSLVVAITAGSIAHCRTELVLDALLMSVWRRRPTETVIVHSDQGTQYGSDAWYQFCVSHNLKPSMSRRGNCWDNAVAESFFSSLKKERIKKQIYRTRDRARADIFDCIEMLYNRQRRHSHLGDVSAEAF